MSYYTKPDNHIRDKVKVVLEQLNFTTKKQLEHVADVNKNDLADKKDVIALKAEVEKLDINKLFNVPNNLNNLKAKVGAFDVGELKLFL